MPLVISMEQHACSDLCPWLPKARDWLNHRGFFSVKHLYENAPNQFFFFKSKLSTNDLSSMYGRSTSVSSRGNPLVVWQINGIVV